MKITAKQFKKGYIYTKNNYTIYYGQNRYYFSSLYDSSIHSTLKEIKQKIINL